MDETVAKNRMAKIDNLILRISPSGYIKLHTSLSQKGGFHKIWNSFSLILARFSSSGLGFITWLIAARLYPAEEVGIASGIISAVMLCVQISLLGLNSAFIAIYPRYKENPSTLMNTALNLVALTSLVSGLVFLLLAQVVFEKLSIVNESWVYILLYLMVTLFATINTLMDHTSIAFRKGEHVLSRNLIFGLVTIGLVAIFPLVSQNPQSNFIIIGWTAAGFSASVLGFMQIMKSLKPYRYRLIIDLSVGKQLIKVGTSNYFLTLAERAPNWVMPIVVTELLSPTQNAYWYTLWMMAWVVYIIPISVGQNLFADISHNPKGIKEAIHFSTRTSIILGLAGGIFAMIFAHFMLSLLGPDYANAGTTPLRILIFGVIPVIFIQAYYAVCRGKHTLREAIITGTISGILGIGGAAFAGIRFGLTGMAAAWLFVQIFTGAWAIIRMRMLTGTTKLFTKERIV